MKMETLKITVLGRNYTIKTEKQAHYIHNLESYVNEKLDSVKKKRGTINDIENLETALKACLEIADDYLSLKEEVEKNKEQLGGVVKRILSA